LPPEDGASPVSALPVAPAGVLTVHAPATRCRMTPRGLSPKRNSEFMGKTFVLVFFVSIALGFSQAEVCQGKGHPGVAALYLAESTGGYSSAKEWASHFRDLIQKSPSYCLVSQKENAVVIVSMLGTDADLNGVSTAISIAVYSTKESIFLAHWLYVSGKESLDSSAQKAVAALEHEVRELKRLRLVR